MNHGSLYTGIGGWLLAAQWAGIENIFTCEIDDFCNKILDKHFPETDRHHDIKETDFTKYAGRIDILSTSDPCQPFSFAGKRSGTTDDRYLWPETVRVIREVKPSFVVFENVPGFISMAFETVASDLEAEGYRVESFVIPACAVGAWHRRDRLWVVAYTNVGRSYAQRAGFEKTGKGRQTNKFSGYGQDVPDTDSIGQNATFREQTKENREWGGRSGNSIRRGSKENGGGGSTQPRLGRMADGLPSWMDYFGTEPDIPRVAKGKKDRANRLKALGNAIYPPVAYIIFETIKSIFLMDINYA